MSIHFFDIDCFEELNIFSVKWSVDVLTLLIPNNLGIWINPNYGEDNKLFMYYSLSVYPFQDRVFSYWKSLLFINLSNWIKTSYKMCRVLQELLYMSKLQGLFWFTWIYKTDLYTFSDKPIYAWRWGRGYVWIGQKNSAKCQKCGKKIHK